MFVILEEYVITFLIKIYYNLAVQYVWLWGWHVFEEIIAQKKRKIKKIITTERKFEKIKNIESLKNIEIDIVDEQKMDKMFDKNHQSIAIYVEQIYFYDLNSWLKKQKQKSFLIACDLIEDPRNLGAIIRTTSAFGADGLLVPKMKTAPFSGVLAKSAAGGLEHLDIVQVVNLSSSLKELKKNGFYVYGLDQGGDSSWKKNDRCVLVLGQEGKGLRRLTKTTCDGIISINTKKNFGVLNVSVAAGIAISKLCE